MKKLLLALLVITTLFSACNNSEGTEAENNESSTNPETESATPQRTGDLAQIDSLGRVLNEDPNNQKAFLMRANLLMKRGETRRAANDIYNAMQLDSSAAEARLLKGQLHFLQNRTRLSKQEWERCIELHPKNTECRLKLAELYTVVMEFKNALKLLDEVISLDKNNAEAYFFKGIVVRDMKQDTALALQYFQRAIDLQQDYVNALDMMGVMLSARHDTLAKYYFQRILEINPNRADIYFKLGVYYMQQDQPNRAMESYTKAIQLNPNDADSYFNLGFILTQVQEYEQARDYFTKAINTREKNYKAYYGRAYTYEMNGMYQEAKADYLKAIESNPAYLPAGDGLQRVNKALDELGKS
ncbi:MAG TPA: hypothetical protein DCG19_13855 [Cryomorphaceae bacterium]|nr:hypothetical protein [Owenweeksia sp.]MBF97718.1 hypothetical protein [Owenweeksia sp.]HAD98489.1 hypothetical protein [Cryomorphaceae bacterium]|tara:strand:+ start:1558 stop:2628 length:1071 start_codon:yes stop_codon:yes gene_type:complete